MEFDLCYQKRGSGYVTITPAGEEWQRFSLHYNLGIITHPYFRVRGKVAYIRQFYYWDGATGVLDTEKIMTPSLIHDMLFQAMRENLIPAEFTREEFFELANKEFRDQYLANDGYKWYSKTIYWGVSKFGWKHSKSTVLKAPKFLRTDEEEYEESADFFLASDI
jgi:hypothetical protein